MNTNKHTPGPWTQDDNSGPTIVHSPSYEATTGGGRIPVARVYDTCDTGQREANARLIAAAPELMAALENALNVLAGIATGDLKTVKADSPAIAYARAAIAKARGQ